LLLGVRDVEFYDFYYRVIYNKSEKNVSEDIVIVSIDSINGRNEIAQTLLDLVNCQPKVIGVDVLFEDFQGADQDSLLIDVVSKYKNIIMACEIDAEQSSIVPSIFDEYISEERLGFVNLIKRNSLTVRTFMPSMYTNGGKIPSFALSILSLYDKDAYNRVIQREREEEKLLFPPIAFNEIDGRNLIHHKAELKDKVVLVGCMSDKSDYHSTPVNEEMAGMEVWALALDNTINHRFLSSLGALLDWFFAIISCLFLTFLYLRLNDTNLQNFGMRLAPMLLILLLCLLGCYLYYFRIYLNVSKAILLSAIGILLLDIFYALSDLIKFLLKKYA
jgi:CHASE2 domain-containing sensor protein